MSSAGRFYARRNSWYARLLVRTPAGFLLVFGGIVVCAWLVATRVELTRYVTVPVERHGSMLVGTAQPSMLRAIGIGGEIPWRAGQSVASPGTLVSWEESGGDDTARFVVRVEGTDDADATRSPREGDAITVDLAAGTETLLDRVRSRALGRRAR
ncbi:MAG: hypothetical protein OXQ31_05080 [Spirochaetaceae bacterium]|nr:hypothetical protein [Spirochaetaceae bacterium]